LAIDVVVHWYGVLYGTLAQGRRGLLNKAHRTDPNLTHRFPDISWTPSRFGRARFAFRPAPRGIAPAEKDSRPQGSTCHAHHAGVLIRRRQRSEIFLISGRKAPISG
jgi:hypothetical protein